MKDFEAASTKRSPGSEHSTNRGGCCNFDINIDARGDVNIYNYCAPSGAGKTEPPTCPPCFPPRGACIPIVPGAKHKLSREQKLSKLAETAGVPSSLAAATMHVTRRFLLGKTAANPLEAKMFATLGQMSRDILSCTVNAFDAIAPNQRNRLFAQSLILNPEQPIDEAMLQMAFTQEVNQRFGILVFDDPNGPDAERPGRVRVVQPQGEVTPFQVRICSINDLRTANFIPEISPGDYTPEELQQQCQIQIVNGQPQQSCQVQTPPCPGNSIATVCARVPEIHLGDSAVLQGVNYFSIDAKVRFTDPQTSNVVRDVDAFVFGDLQTPVTDSQNVLINDCRVHDRITFTVPNDLAPAIYQIQVVCPNITGISEYGAELLSNMEYINVTPSATARFQIAIEQINARKETWPEWPGSDEVGLHTWAAAMGTDFTLIDLDPNNQQNKKLLERAYRHDFDSGTQDSPNLNVFQHDQEILAMFLLVWGDEIDNDDEYKKALQGTADKWYELLVKIVLVEALAIAPFAKYWPWGKFWFVVAAAALFVVDLIWAIWAPADPLIRDVIALSIDDLATLTSANAPAPGPTTYTMDDIVVNVNKTIPPVKLPTLYRETREYVSDGIYELIYRYDHVA